MKKSTFLQAIFVKSAHSMLKLRMSKGPVGLGVYMCVIEALFDESSAMLPKEYDVIAYRFGLSEEEVRSVVEDFGLFEFTDDGMFYCEQLLAERTPKKKQQPKTPSPTGESTEVREESSANNPHLAQNETALAQNETALAQKYKSQADALRNDSEWITRTASTFRIDDISELENYIDQFECACAENEILHCDIKDHKNSFIMWLSSVLRDEY